MPDTYSRDIEEDWVEIFHTGSTTEAMRILDVVLRPAGIDAVLRDRMDHALPAPASEPGTMSIAVPASQRSQAEQLIREDAASLSAPAT